MAKIDIPLFFTLVINIGVNVTFSFLVIKLFPKKKFPKKFLKKNC